MRGHKEAGVSVGVVVRDGQQRSPVTIVFLNKETRSKGGI